VETYASHGAVSREDADRARVVDSPKNWDFVGVLPLDIPPPPALDEPRWSDYGETRGR